MHFLKKAPLHPFLLTVYVVLSLWVSNISQMPFYAILRTMFYAIIFAAAVFLVSWLIFRNRSRAALVTSLVLLLFFYYGHVFEYFIDFQIGGLFLGRHRYLLLLCAVVFVIGVVLTLKTKKKLATVTQYVNIFALFLVVICLVQTGSYGIRSANRAASRTSEESPSTVSMTENTDLPDIYYILVDSHSRQDVLLDDYQIDNSGFIQQLEALGFVVPDCTRSNYDNTEFSMTATLNMDYLDAQGVPMPANADEIITMDFTDRIQHSLVRQTFADMGYQFITFKAVYPFVDVSDSDIYYDAEDNTPFYDKLESINFYYLFLNTTAMKIVVDAQEDEPDRFDFLPLWALKIVNPKATVFRTNLYLQYEQNLYAFDKLENTAGLPGSKFVYAHLWDTHHPFVFNADGTLRSDTVDDYNAYRDQITYTDTRLIEVVETILRDSETPPIIIIQGDHGYVKGEKRTEILNAYYLPDGGNDLVYPAITPVNTFRLILDYYFGGDYPLLPDRSYYAADDTLPYALTQAGVSCVP